MHRKAFLGFAFTVAGLVQAGVVLGQARSSSTLPVPIAATGSLYELTNPQPFSGTRWDPAFDARFDLSAGVLPRHEVRLSTNSRTGWSGGEAGLSGFDTAWTIDPLRATYRYTVMERRAWAWKVGITTRLSDDTPRLATIDRSRFGALPQMHMAGEARLATNWLLSVDADGLMTARGRTFDLGVRVDYLLGRSLYLFGRYRLSDRYVDGDEASAGLSNSANVGLRYRF